MDTIIEIIVIAPKESKPIGKIVLSPYEVGTNLIKISKNGNITIKMINPPIISKHSTLNAIGRFGIFRGMGDDSPIDLILLYHNPNTCPEMLSSVDIKNTKAMKIILLIDSFSGPSVTYPYIIYTNNDTNMLKFW